MECRHESIDGARVELHRPCDSVPAANSGFRLAGQRLRSPHEGLLVLFHAGRVGSQSAIEISTYPFSKILEKRAPTQRRYG